MGGPQKIMTHPPTFLWKHRTDQKRSGVRWVVTAGLATWYMFLGLDPETAPPGSPLGQVCRHHESVRWIIQTGHWAAMILVIIGVLVFLAWALSRKLQR